jgi:hypothetical protein
MTEEDWLACTDPDKMLEFLGDKSSVRKLRLFTVACARLIWEKITWEFLRKAVETAERYADGWASVEELDKTEMFGIVTPGHRHYHEAHEWLLDASEHFETYGACLATTYSSRNLKVLLRMYGWRAGTRLTGPYQPSLLRDICGSLPFRPVSLNPSWLTWKDGTIPKLAQTIYEDRELPTGHLDLDRLAILSDALEDAGCNNPDILGHCRGPGPHVRGCWVVDLILGKE